MNHLDEVVHPFRYSAEQLVTIRWVELDLKNIRFLTDLGRIASVSDLSIRSHGMRVFMIW